MMSTLTIFTKRYMLLHLVVFYLEYLMYFIVHIGFDKTLVCEENTCGHIINK